MNRRAFFGRMLGGLALGAAARSWPFRVFSFSKEIQKFPVLLAPGLREAEANSTVAVTVTDCFFNSGDLVRISGGMKVEPEVMEVVRVSYNQIYVTRPFPMRKKLFGVTA